VLLGADLVGLGQPPGELLVHLGGHGQPERMHHVARGQRVDAQETRAVDPAGQYQVTVQPVAAGHERREAHPDLQGDAGLLRQHLDRPQGRDRGQHGVEGGPDPRAGPGEVPVQVTQSRAGVRLVAAGEASPALWAPPHARHRRCLAGSALRSAARISPQVTSALTVLPTRPV
jgi:hypothetical protein